MTHRQDPSENLLVTEVFYSLQGETSLAGVPFVFVRLTGCNLRCHYCDTAYAFKGRDFWSLEKILTEVKRWPTKQVLITGGEPLLQRGTRPLIQLLISNGYTVSIETHGELPIEPIAPYCRVILDIKTPGSGMQRGGYRINLPHLKAGDEVKFVLANREDYFWAKELLQTEPKLSALLPSQILFSPVISPSTDEKEADRSLSWQWLADQILADGLQVRLQIQLHKLIWGPNKRGV